MKIGISFSLMNIRNFSIIAHIDAGKSTLADRLLELTNTVSSRHMQAQLLDSNPIERERGITIKLAPVTMEYKDSSGSYTLNLIDTPGHVDFNYEVERALQACEAAILLVDATKGVQAQTIANLRLAKKQNLTVIPAINKTDSPLSNVDASIKQLKSLLGDDYTKPTLISAKTGDNVEELLKKVIKLCPPPQLSSPDKPLKALVFNSIYHPHLGAIAFVRLFQGSIVKNTPLKFLSSKIKFTPVEFGTFTPSRTPQDTLNSGGVGYIVTGFKDIRSIKVGDTITQINKDSIQALPGYREIKPNVYQDIFPTDNSKYHDLLDALEKLKLNDSSLTTEPASSLVLGQGVKVGFLGLLHAEVVTERLEREFAVPVIGISPTVEYRANLKSGKKISFSSASEFPDPSQVDITLEPFATVQVITPEEYLGAVMNLCQNIRGSLNEMTYLDKLVQLNYSIPLIEVITSLHDQLKSVSSGFASLEYQLSDWQPAKLVKLTVLLNHDEFEPFSLICIEEQAQTRGRSLATRLKEAIPRQQFEVPIQIALGGKVIARETVKAYRKDVTAKLYGGDATRRKKLLEKQKKGKKRMKQFGSVQLPQEAFLATIK
jgi:GTP-binding protein LepA